MGKTLTEIEAAIRVGMSPTLLRWFTSYAPQHGIDRKLKFTKKGEEYFYDSDELDDFDEFLNQKWPCAPGQTRPTVPVGIAQEIMIEANHQCAFCGYTAHGEGAHIDPVSKSGCNHPHNLIWACPNHHTEYDHGHKVSSVISADHVKVMKKMLQAAQMRRWRMELRAYSNLLAFIDYLATIRKYLKDATFSDIQVGLQVHARQVLKFVGEEAAKPVGAGALDSPQPSAEFKGLLKHIGEIIPARDTSTVEALDEVVEEVVDATEECMEREERSKCPLCKGRGDHNRFRCPICAGDGTVATSDLNDIDLTPYKQVECLLCHGSGAHNRRDCPICHGVGTIDDPKGEEIDLSPFEQVECPLCKGTETHNRRDCPICHGEGTVDDPKGEEIDLTPYEQIDCPLCHGSGARKGGYDCEVCHGEGTIDQHRMDDLDLSPFEQVECPLCEGSRKFKDEECPACHGEGEIDQGYADTIDLGRFYE